MATIKDERKIEIEEVVKELLGECKVKSTPINIVALVKSKDFLVQTADLPLDVTGYLIVNDNEFVDEENKFHRKIIVNRKFKNPEHEESVELKKSRFITAHEFGHFVLHKGKNEALYAHRDSDKRETLQEQEADYFARSILMPGEHFIAMVDLIDSISEIIGGQISREALNELKIERLSEYYRVTKAKVLCRMGDIDLLRLVN